MITSQTKKNFLGLMLFSIMLSVTASHSFAQDAAQPPVKEMKNVFKSNPFYALGGWVPITYEHFYGRKKSFTVGASYITNPYSLVLSTMGNGYPYRTRYGFYINPSFRIFLYKTPGMPGGFYVSPEIGYIMQNKFLQKDSLVAGQYDPKSGSTVSTTTYFPERKIITHEFQSAITIGYQTIFSNVFVLDLYVGEGLSIVRIQGNSTAFFDQNDRLYSNDITEPRDGARLLGGFKIGVPF